MAGPLESSSTWVGVTRWSADGVLVCGLLCGLSCSQHGHWVLEGVPGAAPTENEAGNAAAPLPLKTLLRNN